MKVGRRIPTLPCVIFICMLGFLMGTAIVSLWQENLFLQNNVLDIDFIGEINKLYVDKRALFFLCLRKRLCAFLVLLFLSSSSWNVLIVLVFYIFQGFSIGSIVEVLVIRYGWEGLAIYLSVVFPHCIFYIAGYFLMGCWCLNREKEESQGTLANGRWKVVFVSGILILLGIYVESLFSFKIFSFFLNV